MAKDNSVSEAQDFERRNTDPTIPIDGSAPENIAGPNSNAELEVAARKRSAAADGLSDRLRPEHARQRLETGDAVTDSDVNAAPSAGLNVAEDSGEKERKEAQEEVQGRSTTNPRSRTTSESRNRQNG